ncbi:MAG: Mannosyl-glycoprotein endo-beta-N-acetylglucosaminidase [Acidobacteria bacterium]|nr:Mannosyl-glycoprotein endo-beta-N-acetylglucosaminidase [Acidobacteriota bacterium]
MLCLAALAAGCAPRSRRPAVPPPPSPLPVVGIMGEPRLTAAQLAAWFDGRAGNREAYSASVPVGTLAQYYIEEGAAEGITGDVAFVQAIVETGWFRFEGLVRAGQNNFAGIGATDASAAPASFADARLGVRAQVQHLRAYADPTALACESPPLHHPCADPRFHLVTPKGKARSWNEMGGGNWATAGGYGETIVRLYLDAVAHSAARPTGRELAARTFPERW